MGDLPAVWAQKWGDQVAVVERDRVFTFTDLETEVGAVAVQLAALDMKGAPHGDRVLVQLPNTVELIVILLACFRLGLVPVLALPGHRSAELEHLAAMTEARAIVVPNSFRGFDHRGLALQLIDQHDVLNHLIVVNLEQQTSAVEGRLRFSFPAPVDSPRSHNEPPSSDTVAVLLLSGGTTGTPKLIPRTHDDYIYNFRACAEAAGFTRDTVLLLSIPVAHNFGLACPGALGVLDAGGRVVLEPSPDPEKAFRAMIAENVTDAALVPAVLQRWMDEMDTTGVRPPSLRRVQVGGARLSDEVARRVRPGFGLQLQQALGMAEGLVNYVRPDDPDIVGVETQGRPVSEYDEVRIVDRNDVDVAHGRIGQLLTRGPYTIRGYWRAREHNLSAFDSQGWYRTGDLVRWHSTGNLTVEGRVKDVINRAGEKISAEEVENYLYALPGVLRVAVVAIPDTTLGESIGAVIVPLNPSEPPTVEWVRSRLLAAGVAAFKIPQHVRSVDDLPLTKVGKIDKAAVRRLFTQD